MLLASRSGGGTIPTLRNATEIVYYGSCECDDYMIIASRHKEDGDGGLSVTGTAETPFAFLIRPLTRSEL